MKGYGRAAVLAPVLVALETVCELILPLLMAGIIDDGISQSNLPVILQLGAAMLVVATVSMCCGIFSARFAAEAAQGLGASLRKAEFDKISTFSFADIDRFSSASLITRMTNDVTNIQMVVAICLRMLVRALVMMVMAMGVALWINAGLAVWVFVVLPVVGITLFALMRICNPLFQKMQRKLDALNQTIQENLIGVRVVKAFVRQDFEREKFRTANDEFTKAGLSAVLRVVMMSPVLMMGVSTATVLILYHGGVLVLQGGMEIGELSSLLNYIFNILFSVMMVGMALLQYTRAEACAKRVFEVLDAVPDIQSGQDIGHQGVRALRGQVEFRDVAFKYSASGTGDDVLHGISFTAKPGQVVAIVGGTGVGKSTLVNLIPRFYDVTAGEVLVDGVNVRDYSLDTLRNKVGMVLQKNVLFSGTIRENLLWGDAEATEEEIIQAAKDAQAYDFIMSFPDGFDTYLEQGGVNVSGGQKQRLCIARAMLRKPSVLILDDSTSAVDSATEALIRESFHQNLKDTTVILIAQRISSVMGADQIIVLDDGTIAGAGTHDELMASNAIYQEIYWSQQEGVSEHG